MKVLKELREYCYGFIYFRDFRMYRCNHFTIGLKKLASYKIKFPHPIGIVIGIGVEFGSNCVVYQNVTIGTKGRELKKDGEVDKYPKLGDNVIVYPSSILIGDITIGNNVVIGAGTLVTKSIPPNSMVYGNPIKIIPYLPE